MNVSIADWKDMHDMLSFFRLKTGSSSNASRQEALKVLIYRSAQSHESVWCPVPVSGGLHCCTLRQCPAGRPVWVMMVTNDALSLLRIRRKGMPSSFMKWCQLWCKRKKKRAVYCVSLLDQKIWHTGRSLGLSQTCMFYMTHNFLGYWKACAR